MMKVAIIGAGRNQNGIGEYIARYFHRNGAVVGSVLGTTDQTARRASANLRKYGIEAVPYTDFRRLIETQRPETVVIASPASTHAEYLLKCIDAGVNIFCEKPFIWPVTDDFNRTLEDIFKKVSAKKLTVAMNAQLPFSLKYYQELCGPVDLAKAGQFEINMSPSCGKKEMIPESVPHPLSILYCVLGKGEVGDCSFQSAGKGKMTIILQYASRFGKCQVLIKLASQEKQPRDFSFGFDEQVVKRIIDPENYDIYFSYQGKKLKLIDPLDLSIRDFMSAVEKKTDPLIGPDHILNNMVALKKIYDAYEES